MSDEQTENPRLASRLWHKLRDLFHLSLDTDKAGTILSIQEGIEFRGNGLWSLVIAIFIASIGLNVNSAAVIIGAMLISPLMGPIAGAGLALGIFDMALLRRSLFNLAIMTVISVVTSWMYFSVSPLSGATPELLSRTTPTFYDVLIAIFGGMALIIAVSRKNRSTNSLAGVAIATALMPPLCAAGFGLANHNFGFFFGALYLYLINSVFIGLTTFIFTKYLRLGSVEGGTHKLFTKRNVTLMVLVAILFITPSIFMANDVIQETDFRSKADKFISSNMVFSNSQVLSVKKTNKSGHRQIEVTMVGAPLAPEMIDHLNLLLPQYGLAEATLKIIQNNASDVATQIPLAAQKNLNSPQIDPAVSQTTNELTELREKLRYYTDKTEVLNRTTKEIEVLFPEIEKISFGDMLVHTSDTIESTRKYTVLVKWARSSSENLKAKLKLYLKLRLELEDLDVVDW